MLTTPTVAALLAFSLFACVFAFVKGGPAERIGAVVILANLAFTLANEYLQQNQIIMLSVDGLTAVVLLGIALRYASFWLGTVMLLYAFQFGLHAFYFVSERPRDLFHVVANNVNFLAISLSLVIGTAMSWRQRAKAARRPSA